MQKKNKTVALTVAGLLIATGIIYLISAYEEPIQAAEESNANIAGSSSSAMDIGTLVQTTFFAITGLASIGVAVWISITSRKRIMIQHTAYIVAAAGSAFLILFYIVSRTVNLPIVGIQTDIGSIDIITKVLQGIVVGLSVYTVSTSHKMLNEIRNRLT
jgi:hypothetical protein